MQELIGDLGLGASAGAITVAFLNFLYNRFLRSGRVRTTDAEALWNEARQLRTDLTTERDMLRTELVSLRLEHDRQRADYEAKISALQVILDRSKAQIEQLQFDILALRAETTGGRNDRLI